MTNPDQLAITADAFNQWRQKRENPSKRTPLALRQQAVSLYKTYSSSKITAALNISGTQLKQWIALSVSNDPSPAFVKLPQSSAPLIDNLNIDLSFANGANFSLSGTISSTLITTIIQELKS